MQNEILLAWTDRNWLLAVRFVTKTCIAQVARGRAVCNGTRVLAAQRVQYDKLQRRYKFSVAKATYFQLAEEQGSENSRVSLQPQQCTEINSDGRMRMFNTTNYISVHYLTSPPSVSQNPPECFPTVS